MGSSPSSEVKPGDRLGRYTVVRRLASGGMAEVYLARHEGPKGFSKLVVIKRVLPGLQQTEKFSAMFLDEGRLAARLSHPSIAQTFELGEHDGGFHIVMEYVAGESLNRLVKRSSADGKTIPPGSVLRVAMQILEALDYAHDLKGDRGEWLKVVHRDVSPTNVIITYHGAVKLLDFGIARSATHEHHTQIGTVKGKGGYMSPEQAQAGTVDQRTDIYAVGSLLYLLTTGSGPFDGQEDVFAMMKAAVDGRFPKPTARNPSLSPQLEQIILKAMSQKVEDRYPTAGVMLAALEEYSASQRLFPSSRELTLFMRQLFPERVELARSYDSAPDDALVAKLAESFNDVESSEIISTPTRLARGRPASKSDEAPVARTVPVAIAKSSRPTVKTLDRLENTALPLREGISTARVNTRTVPLSTTKLPVPELTNQTGPDLGVVRELGKARSERPTQEQRAMYGEEGEEKTAGVPFDRLTARRRWELRPHDERRARPRDHRRHRQRVRAQTDAVAGQHVQRREPGRRQRVGVRDCRPGRSAAGRRGAVGAGRRLSASPELPAKGGEPPCYFPRR